MNKINYEELLNKAKIASETAYSPYSKFPVGASVLFESGKTYLGSNVENVSYGLTLCAERNAISTAICCGEKTKIKAIAIYSPKQTKCLPCGACRQWISEFAINENETQVVLEDENKKPYVVALVELFPYGFKFL